VHSIGGGWVLGHRARAASRYGRILDVESSRNWLERYRRGQRELVWHELRQLGSGVREPGRFEEAQLVCDEMARRVRQNIEVIIERLASAGYRFHTNDDEQAPVTPYIPPTAAAAELYFEGERESWHSRAGADRMFVLPVSPDMIHKDNVSGGPPYGIILPDGCADGLFVAETTMPFVSYLKWVFSNGGFPWPTAPDNHWQLKKALAKDLLPL
jgi:hypothetical protein